MWQDFELPDSNWVKELRIKKVTRTISSVDNDTLKKESYEITNYDIEGKIISDSNFWFDKGYGKSADTVHNYIYKDGLLVCDSALVIPFNSPEVFICKTTYYYNKKRQLIEWRNWLNCGWNYTYYNEYKIKMTLMLFGKKQFSKTFVNNPKAPFRSKTIQSELYQSGKYSYKSIYLYGYNEYEKMVNKICIYDSKSYFSYRIEKYKYDDNGAGNLIHSTMELQRSGGDRQLEETINDYSYYKENGLLKSKQVRNYNNTICTYKYEFYPTEY